MRKFIFITIILFCSITNAQISFGNSEARGASLLDLGTGDLNGIVLPYNYTTNNPTEGTLRVDATTSKIQFYADNSWVDLTEEGQLPQMTNSNLETDDKAGLIISDTEDDTNYSNGILVLNSNNKALILPQISNPHLNVVDPPTGMMCYDPTNKVIAIFNGINWYFYK